MEFEVTSGRIEHIGEDGEECYGEEEKKKKKAKPVAMYELSMLGNSRTSMRIPENMIGKRLAIGDTIKLSMENDGNTKKTIVPLKNTAAGKGR